MAFAQSVVLFSCYPLSPAFSVFLPFHFGFNLTPPVMPHPTRTDPEHVPQSVEMCAIPSVLTFLDRSLVEMRI
ncbi:hypothetical protein EDB89DRAFT_547825 [Lactarius sanguifluus]|nr:hypothetical protein EDB89DRAFT_547825 [Lactarius sanguifluus]